MFEEEGKENIFINDVQSHTAKALLLSSQFKALRTSLVQPLFIHISISAGKDRKQSRDSADLMADLWTWKQQQVPSSSGSLLSSINVVSRLSHWMAIPPFTAFTNHQNNPKPGHPDLSKTRPQKASTVLLAANPVALCSANFLWDFCCCFLQIWGFLLLLNLSTRKTEEEIPNETLPFVCLKKDYALFIFFLVQLFYCRHFQTYSKWREYVNELPCIFRSVLTIKNILPCNSAVEKYPLHRWENWGLERGNVTCLLKLNTG